MKMYLHDVREAKGFQWRLAPPAGTFELANPITEAWVTSQQQVLRLMRKYPQHMVYILADYAAGVYTVRAVGSEIDIRENGLSTPSRQTAARRAAQTRKLRKSGVMPNRPER